MTTSQSGSSRETSQKSDSVPSDDNGTPASQRYDELAERLSEGDGIDEDIAQFLARNWQKLVGLFMVVLLAVWLGGKWQETNRMRQGKTAESFASAQAAFSIYAKAKLEGNAEESATEEFAKVEEQLRILEKTAGEGLYSQLTDLYLAVGEILKKDFASARQRLEGYDVQKYASISAPVARGPLGEEDIVQDLAALLYARSLLLEGTPESITKARPYLRGLAFGGSVANLEALIALARLASTEEELSEVQELAKTVSTARPALAAQIQQEMTALGVRIEE